MNINQNPVFVHIVSGIFSFFAFVISLLNVPDITKLFVMLCAMAQFVWWLIQISKSIKKGAEDEADHPAA